MAAEGVIAQKRQAEELLATPCFLVLEAEHGMQGWPSSVARGVLKEYWEPIEQCAQSAKSTGKPFAMTTDKGSVAFALPLRTADRAAWFLTGISTTFPVELFQPLLQATFVALSQTYDLEQQQIQLDASAMQIARSFEEQCWLRELTKHLGLVRTGQSAQNIAAEILHPLRTIAHARQLGIIMTPGRVTHRFDMSSAIYGEGHWTLQDAQFLVEQNQSSVIWEPLVANMRFTEVPSGMIPSYVIVPIGELGNPFAFIVALERLPPPVGSGFLYDPEFGSFEVGLMQEAGALLSTQAHNMRLFAETQHLVLGTLRAMTRAIDARDSYTQGHSERVAKLAFELAREMALPEGTCQEIYLAGILHDIGKIGVPDAVLLKQSALTDEEFEIIKLHPVTGFRIIEQLAKFDFALPGILHHHERFDGKGYPHQLSGENIPLMARILAVADSFDAMTSSRPYRKCMELSRARQIIRDGANTQWDPYIVQHFLKWLDEKIPHMEPGKEISPLLEQNDSTWEAVSSAVLSLDL